MLPRTEKQVEILRFIESFTMKRGVAPSYATIARHIGVKSRATVAKHLQGLERRGLLKREWKDGLFSIRVAIIKAQCPRCSYIFLRQSEGADQLKAGE